MFFLYACLSYAMSDMVLLPSSVFLSFCQPACLPVLVDSPSCWYSSIVFFSPTLKPSVCSGTRSSLPTALDMFAWVDSLVGMYKSGHWCVIGRILSCAGQAHELHRLPEFIGSRPRKEGGCQEIVGLELLKTWTLVTILPLALARPAL